MAADIAKLCRKSKWHGQYSTNPGNSSIFFLLIIILVISLLLLHIQICSLMNLFIGNFIAGLDFDPTGESVATIDCYGMCLISDVNTDNYGFHCNVGTKEGGGNLVY